MRALLQRVTSASVAVDGAIVGEIGGGMLVLLGVQMGDQVEQAEWLAQKTLDLRIFADDHKPMNASVTDVGGSVLVVSQFTLAGSLARGRRPSFSNALAPELAEPLIERFVDQLRAHGMKVESGRFGAHMEVELVNDGPVTFVLDL